MSVNKRFYYKVYGSNQAYINTWSKEVVTDPQFRTVMNGGAGELKITLARNYNSFGEGDDVTLGNKIELWIADNDNIANNANPNTLWDVAYWDTDVWDTSIKSFMKLYSGYISAYAPIVDDESSYTEITVLGYITQASMRIIRAADGSTTITYTSQDPGTIARDLIDKYRADGGVDISYLGSSIQYTGTLVTYTFQNLTLKECLDKLIKLCPDGWFYSIDSSGVLYLKSSSATADHRLVIGQDIKYMQTNKRIENLTNVVYLVGGGSPQLYRRYERAGSIASYGKFEYKLQDGGVTDTTTADYMAKRHLDKYQSPETRTVLKIIDNNGEGNEGENLESYLVGDTIQIKNLKYGNNALTMWDEAVWDVDVWDYPISFTGADVLTIVSITYHPDYLDIEASSRLPETSKRVEDIFLTTNKLLQTNLPSSPTAGAV